MGALCTKAAQAMWARAVMGALCTKSAREFALDVARRLDVWALGHLWALGWCLHAEPIIESVAPMLRSSAPSVNLHYGPL